MGTVNGTPFSEAEQYQAWLAADAANRGVAGCERCGGSGRRKLLGLIGHWCRFCGGWGFVAVERDELGKWRPHKLKRSRPGFSSPSES